MISHTASGDHQYARTKTATDKAILYYAQQKHVLSSSTQTVTSPYLTDLEDSTKANYLRIFTQGWARKVRVVKRFTPKQKDFIKHLYDRGALTKAKLSPEQMAQQLRDHMVDGKYFFKPEEYLQPKQIRGIISSLKKRDHATVEAVLGVSEDDGVVDHIEDICDSVLYSGSDADSDDSE